MEDRWYQAKFISPTPKKKKKKKAEQIPF
jgi:hypothetical protein